MLTPFLLVGVVTSQTFPTGMFFGNCPQNFYTFTGQPLKREQSADSHCHGLGSV